MHADTQRRVGRPSLSSEGSEQVAVRYPRHVLDMVEEIIVERGNVTDRATILREATVRGLELMLKRSKN